MSKSKLDPRPWVYPDGARETHYRSSDGYGVGTWFSPRPQYSQNRADYEGQTQQGDER